MLHITRVTARLTSVFHLAEIGGATEGEVMVGVVGTGARDPYRRNLPTQHLLGTFPPALSRGTWIQFSKILKCGLCVWSTIERLTSSKGFAMWSLKSGRDWPRPSRLTEPSLTICP